MAENLLGSVVAARTGQYLNFFQDFS